VTLTFHWFLPTNGDSRDVVGGGHGSPVTDSGRDRPPTVAYLGQIARAAEDLGFAGALTPTGAWCEDAWLTTAMVSRHTERLKFLVAFRPGFVSPTLAAQMASTFQRLSGGRLLLNVVTGGESREQRAYGDFLDKDARYRRTGEFLTVVRQLWEGKPVDLHGEHLRVEGAELARLPDPVPRVYFGGSSPAAAEVAARHADVYLTWGEPPAQVAEKVARLRELAAARGRTLRFGVRLHVITRDTAQAAWAEADRLLAGFDPETVRSVQAGRRAGRASAAAPRTRCGRCRPGSPAASPRGSGGCSPCTAAGGTAWRSTPTCGPASAWCAAAPAPPWSVTTTRWPTGSRSTTPWGSTSSCSPATRTWRRRTGSARASCRGWPPGVCGGARRPFPSAGSTRSAPDSGALRSS
jgi:alkanesulfonate monooxygenase